MDQGNNFAQLTDGNGIDFSTRVPLAKKYKIEVLQLSSCRHCHDMCLYNSMICFIHPHGMLAERMLLTGDSCRTVQEDTDSSTCRTAVVKHRW